MRKKYKIGLVIIVILILLLIFVGLSKLFIEDKKDDNKIKNVTSVEVDIKDYGYTLDDRDTKYMQEVFRELQDILKNEEIDYQEYAQTLTKLFIIDFYTLNNKINKYDVGSLEYVYEDKKDEFQQKAMDTIYNDIIDNTYSDRKQELPEIADVEILGIEEEKFNLNEKQEDAYKVTMRFTYIKDLGYDKEGTLYLIKNNNKLEVVSYNPSITSE